VLVFVLVGFFGLGGGCGAVPPKAELRNHPGFVLRVFFFFGVRGGFSRRLVFGGGFWFLGFFFFFRLSVPFSFWG